MGVMKSILIELQNHFPEENDYNKLFFEFSKWLDDHDKNQIYVESAIPGIYLDLCNSSKVNIDQICDYWCQHIKKGIHNGEGFVINDKDLKL